MQRFGRQLGALALLAMLVRALIPTGYMLAEADTGNGRYLVVQMCDGHAVSPQVIDLDTGKVVDQAERSGKSGGKKADAPCAFAASPHVASPPTTIEPAVFAYVMDPGFVAPASITPGRGIAAPPPPATGPPRQI